MHLHDCRCFQVHLRLPLKYLGAHCSAQGESGSIWDYFWAWAGSTGVTRSCVCCLRTILHYADVYSTVTRLEGIILVGQITYPVIFFPAAAFISTKNNLNCIPVLTWRYLKGNSCITSECIQAPSLLLHVSVISYSLCLLPSASRCISNLKSHSLVASGHHFVHWHWNDPPTVSHLYMMCAVANSIYGHCYCLALCIL